MAYDEQLARRVRVLSKGRRAVVEKKMFGGLAFMSQGKMFAGILKSDLVIRVGPDASKEALKKPHTRPMDFTGRPMKGYVYVGPGGIKTAAQLRAWLTQGLAFTSRLPAQNTNCVYHDIDLNRPTCSPKEASMQRTIGVLALVFVLTGLSGCSYLFYPNAKEFAAKAKGTTELETLVNLANMMEASANASKGGKGYNQPLNDLHNQFHAFDNHLCCLDKAKRDMPAYALTVTHNKELWAIFKRIWKFKDDQPQRDQHLDLFAAELRETRDSLQALK